jgi:hypothetical protein
MTFGTDQKRHLLRRFKECYQHTYPTGVSVHMRDFMQDLHSVDPGRIQTIQDFLHLHIQRHVRDVLDDDTKGVNHFYALLDRGGNLAKKLFTSRHRSKVPPALERQDGRLCVPADGRLPVEWDNIIANREMTSREVKPLYYRALIAEYDPPPGKFVILDSASSRQLTQEEARLLGPDAYNKVYGVRTSPLQMGAVQMSSRDLLNTPVGPARPVTERFQCPPELYTHNIQEADLSAFFHAHKHVCHPGAPPGTVPGQVIVIDGNDGDYVMAALLACGDRIDRNTSRFNSRVWIKLKGQKAARTAFVKRRKTKAEAARVKATAVAAEGGNDDETEEKEASNAAKNNDDDDDPVDGRDVYININKLFLLMDQDPDLSAAQFPVGMGVLLYILSGTDFFDDFLGDDNSIFYGMGWETSVWDTWCAHKERFANLIMLFYTGPAGYNQPDLCRRPYIDEEAMLTFFHQCYATKYGKTVRNIYDVEQVTTDQLRQFTRSFAANCKRKPGEEDEKWERRFLMARKKAMPEDSILRRYCRLALLNWTYWLNGYRPGGDAFCDPLEMYEGLPYYGYMQHPQNPGAYTLSPVVSPPKPIPENVMPYLGRHTAEAKAAAREAKQVAREQLQKEDEEAKEMARDHERIERQRKLTEKQKRLDAQDKQRAAPPGRVPKRAPPRAGPAAAASALSMPPPQSQPAATVQSRLTHTAQLTSVPSKGVKRSGAPLQRE